MIAIQEVSTFSKIPNFVPFGVLYYTQDTSDLYIGTGTSVGPAVMAVAGGGGGTPGGDTGQVQINIAGAFAGQDAGGGYMSFGTDVPDGFLVTDDAEENYIQAGASNNGLSINASPSMSIKIAGGASLALGLGQSFNLDSGGQAGLQTNADSSGVIVEGSLQLSGKLFDGGGSSGSSGQLLTSTGTAVAWATSLPWNAAGNATGNLSLSNAGYTSTFNQTSAVAWLWANTATGTGSSTNASPVLELGANYYTGAASAQDLWTIGTSLAAGTNGTSTLSLAHSGSTGSATIVLPSSASSATVPAISWSGGTAGYGIGGQSAVSLNLYAPTSSGAAVIQITQAGLARWGISVGDNSAANQQFSIQPTYANFTQAFAHSNTTGTSNPGFQFLDNGGNNGHQAATSGTQVHAQFAGSFVPSSGSAAFIGLNVKPTIHQTSSASGSYTALQINAVETALLGSSNFLINALAGSAGATSKFSVDNSGNVIAAGNYTSGASAGVSAGSFSAITAITTVGGIVTQLTGSSDERLKDSAPYAGGLPEILAIQPVCYRWNDKGQKHTGLDGAQEYVGFLAQNVQRAIPQAITNTEGPEGYLSFDDRPVIAALVNAVKELTERIKILETR